MHLSAVAQRTFSLCRQVVGQKISFSSISRKHWAAVSPRKTVNHLPVCRKYARWNLPKPGSWRRPCRRVCRHRLRHAIGHSFRAEAFGHPVSRPWQSQTRCAGSYSALESRAIFGGAGARKHRDAGTLTHQSACAADRRHERIAVGTRIVGGKPNASQTTPAKASACRLSSLQTAQGRAAAEVPSSQGPQGAASTRSSGLKISNEHRRISPAVTTRHDTSPLGWSQDWSHPLASAANHSEISASEGLPSLPWAQGGAGSNPVAPTKSLTR